MNTTPNDQSPEHPEYRANDGDNSPTPSEWLLLIRACLKRYSESPQERPKWTDVATVILTLIIAAAAIGSAWIFQGQLTEASNATNRASESFRIDERAWIEFDPVKPVPYSPRTDKFGALFDYDLYIRNTGKTVARDVEFRANRSGEESSIEMGNDAKGIAWEQDQLMLGKVPSGADIPFQNPFEKTLAPNTATTNPFVFKGQEPINGMTHYLIGRIDYCDIFKVKHWKKFCFFVANSRGEFWPCREGNDEDRNSEEPTRETSCGKRN